MIYLSKVMLLCVCCVLVVTTLVINGKADNMSNIAGDDIAKAEEIIKNYVNEKYSWNEGVYEILMESENGARVSFLVYHQDDKIIVSPGGGKSFIIQFDMQNMRVLEEIHFQ